MASLMDSRTDQKLRPVCSDADRFNRLSPNCSRNVAVDGHREFAAWAGRGGGHLDFLVAGYDTSGKLGSTVGELATASVAMTNDQIALRAGTARRAQNEGFEETAGWFETWPEPVYHTQAKCGVPSTT
jgi:hypothetical protein